MKRTALFPCIWALAAAAALGQEVTVATLPPVVVRTGPQSGATDVDPSLGEIRATFSKEMIDGNWSVVQISPTTMPQIAGKLRYEKDKRTFVAPVKLEPGRTYAVWLNTERFGNFKDLDGRPAIPYLLAFQTKGTGRRTGAPKASRDGFAAAFDALCDDMARHYSYFALKGVDWDPLRRSFRPKAATATSKREFVAMLKVFLSQLRDGHVWIEAGGEQVGTFIAPRRPANINRQATLESLEHPRACGELAVVGRTRADEFAALVLTHQSAADSTSVQEVVAFLRKADAHGARGFIVDLRIANGGDESLAAEIARAFCGEETVYARSKFRSGPSATDFGQSYERTLKPADPPIRKPVICLIGPGCVSSGEGFAEMMKCLPQVTLVGTPTRGSSGNPQPFELPGLSVTVWYSRWVDMLPDGTPIEDRGVAPDVVVDRPAADYADGDPTWEKALEILREKVAKSGR